RQAESGRGSQEASAPRTRPPPRQASGPAESPRAPSAQDHHQRQVERPRTGADDAVRENPPARPRLDVHVSGAEEVVPPRPDDPGGKAARSARRVRVPDLDPVRPAAEPGFAFGSGQGSVQLDESPPIAHEARSDALRPR